MTKIFIDTNIFLDMYRTNLANDISTLMGFLFKNKKYFITTEQSINEFTRNRLTVLENVAESFKKGTDIEKGASGFLRTLPSFKKYDESLSKYRAQRQAILNEIREKEEKPDADQIYTKFMKLCRADCVIPLTDEIIDRASRRKTAGNPPTSDKYTCGDEIIWESLLTNAAEQEDMIFVTNDQTFAKNREFLATEYNRKTGGKWHLCNNILQAYRMVGVNLTENVVHAAENLTWTEIVETALINLGGEAALTDIYNEANDILYYNDCYTKMQNRAKESTIRGILQRFSSDFPAVYNGRKDLFRQISDGVWALR